ncbi:MAG: ADP-ribosylglycohydrolase family protein [Isosphaeraceae bacterium]
MPQLNRSDRVRGSLLGLAVGDALGAPLEGLSSQQIRAHYGVVDDYVDGTRAWKKKPYRWRMPGLYTDDTQQALALCDVLLECGEIVPERLATIYLALANPKGTYLGAHRGVGRSFRQVLTELERGVSPWETGQSSAGIGAAMRIAPIALFFNDDLDALFDGVMAASLMTHRDVRSLSGALVVCHTVRRLLDGERREPSLLFRIADDVARDERLLTTRHAGSIDVGSYRGSLAVSVAKVERLLDMPRERALLALVEEANRHGAMPVCKRPTMGFPPVCVPACLYVLMTTDNFEDALTEVINLGGDADSAGAILGAMAGACHGLVDIPERWLNKLENREGIELRAIALDRKSSDGLDLPDLVEREHELSGHEANYRDALRSSLLNGGDHGANSFVDSEPPM